MSKHTIIEHATTNLCQYLDSVQNIANLRNSTTNPALRDSLAASLNESDNEIDSLVVTACQTLIKRIQTIKQSFRSKDFTGDELTQFHSDERNMYSSYDVTKDVDYAKQERDQAERNRVRDARLKAEYNVAVSNCSIVGVPE
jgi:hypothetical protein